MKLERLIFFWVSVLVFLGCKEKEPETYYVSQEMLRYCWFPAGSYWIYEEDSTPGWMDSVYVSNPLHVIEPVEGEDYISEGFGNDIELRGLKFRQGSQADPGSIDGNVTISYVSEFYSDSGGQLHDYLLFMNSDGGNVLSKHSSTKRTNQFDSIAIHNITYFNAVEITTSPASEADFTVASIWAKDIGVLHRRLKDGTSWSLVRYRIAH